MTRALLAAVAIALVGCGFDTRSKAPDASLEVAAPLLLNPTLDREAVYDHLGPMMGSLGYWHEADLREHPARGIAKVNAVRFTWATKPPSQIGHAFRVDVNWRAESPRQLTVDLTEHKGERKGTKKLDAEVWLRWRALKEALESSPVVQDVQVQLHPAVDTAPEERAFLAAATGVGLPEWYRDGMSAEALSAAQEMGLFAPAPMSADAKDDLLVPVESIQSGAGQATPGSSVGAVLNDPMPPELEAGSLLIRAAWRIEAGDAGGAQAVLDEVRTLRRGHGFEMPDGFWFRQAQAHRLAGRQAEAERWALHYVALVGPRGEYAAAALALEKAARLERLGGELDRWRAEEAPRQVAEAQRLAAGGGRFRDPLRSGGEGPLMAALPAGWYLMGSPDGFAVHRVDIERPFAVGVHEVTVDEWSACAVAGGCTPLRDDEDRDRNGLPAKFVRWEDAQSYARWLSSETRAAYRLPSEAEWEYAARAGSAAHYSWGDEAAANLANCAVCGPPEDEPRRVAPVGTFPANAFGLHDLHGNVSEWVQDCWSQGYRGAPTDGSARTEGDCSRRVHRGGWWGDSPWSARSAARWFHSKSKAVGYIGFRVARELPRPAEE